MVLAWPTDIWQLPLSSAMLWFESVEWFATSVPVAPPVEGGWAVGAPGSTGPVPLPGRGYCVLPVVPAVPLVPSGMPMPMPPVLGPPP